MRLGRSSFFKSSVMILLFLLMGVLLMGAINRGEGIPAALFGASSSGRTLFGDAVSVPDDIQQLEAGIAITQSTLLVSPSESLDLPQLETQRLNGYP